MSVPLDGRQLDPGEWYFNCYNEFYFSYAGFGYQTLDWGKLEIGSLAQYSVVNYDKDFKSFYALQFGWILKFK